MIFVIFIIETYIAFFRMETHIESARDTSPPLPQPPCNYERQELPEVACLKSPLHP